jgi:hypothetical protein
LDTCLRLLQTRRKSSWLCHGKIDELLCRLRILDILVESVIIQRPSHRGPQEVIHTHPRLSRLWKLRMEKCKNEVPRNNSTNYEYDITLLPCIARSIPGSSASWLQCTLQVIAKKLFRHEQLRLATVPVSNNGHDSQIAPRHFITLLFNNRIHNHATVISS